jgi:hypothetical protein
MKTCPKCKQTKSVGEFYKDKSTKDGIASWCKKCNKQAHEKYRKTEKGKEVEVEYRNSEKGREVVKQGGVKYCKTEKGKEAGKRRVVKHQKEKPHRVWAIGTLSQHRRKGNEIEISTDELEIKAKQSTHCNFCGCKLNWGYGKGHSQNSPSLDRINNENIITSDNIQILCTKCNASKQDRTMSELINWCKTIVKKFDLVIA